MTKGTHLSEVFYVSAWEKCRDWSGESSHRRPGWALEEVAAHCGLETHDLPLKGSHILYKHISHGGELLYVGMTSNFGARQVTHVLEASWWWKVSRIVMSEYHSREALALAEKEAISTLSPTHNGGRG